MHIGPRTLNAIIAIGKYLPGASGGMIGHLRTMRFWQPLNNAQGRHRTGIACRGRWPIRCDDALAWFKIERLP